MKEKLLYIAEWYDCFNEHPEVIPFTPSKVCRNWRNGDVKQKAWVALAVREAIAVYIEHFGHICVGNDYYIDSNSDFSTLGEIS